MDNYHEILRLRSLGYTKRQIATSIQSSRNTISEVYRLADFHGISWSTHYSHTNEDIKLIIYILRRKIHSCDSIHKELAKPGVTLTLLWSEYCEQSRIGGLISY